jgi:predicted transcriptional regulator of viral defense system
MPDTYALDTLYRIAEPHAGYFTTTQAVAAGVAHQLLHYHLEAQNILRVERGVYRLTNYPASRFEDVMATLLWVGSDAAASHDTALSLFELANAMPGVIHVTSPRRIRKARNGVAIHRHPLGPSDVVQREGLAVTSIVRTLRDIAADRAKTQLAAADALERGLVRRRRLLEATRQYPDTLGFLEDRLGL